MSLSPDRVRQIAETHARHAVDLRRQFCRWPERSGEEEQTAARVAAVLRQLDIPCRERVGGFGVVGLIEGGQAGPTVALRADMDALPLTDHKQSPYASQVPGLAHACGHDVHTAILLGAAMVLSGLRQQLPGRVKLIFQPAEENASGAARMLGEGALENPRADCIVGLHCHPALAVGELGISPGATMAASEAFDIVIHGRGGHAARPHETVDAVLVAANALAAIHQIVSRRIDPLKPAVITVGKICGGTARNVITDRVEIQGTLRCLDEDVRVRLKQYLEEVLDGVTRSHGARYELRFFEGTPALINDGALAARVSAAAAEILGSDAVRPLAAPSMGGEDFAFYLQDIPGCFVRLGTRGADAATAHPLHSACFDIDEAAIPAGMAFLSWTAIRLLEGGA